MFYAPTKSPEDWKPLLAQPERQWKTGYSAKALAYCWEEAQGFPGSVVKVFQSSKITIFADIKILLAFPEYKVPLPGGKTESQSDIFIIAKGADKLISITVEGKALEGFGESINEWSKNKSPGKETRYNYLTDLLMLKNRDTSHIKYQLLHRTASAIIEAQKFNAQVALMLVHSFSDDPQAFNDYRQFLNLFDVIDVQEDSLVFAKNIKNIDIYCAWIKAERKYLEEGDYQEDLASYTKQIELDPKPYHYRNRGSVYQQKGDYTNAIADYSKAIELETKGAEFHYFERGGVYLELHDYDKAIADYTKAIEIYPGFQTAYINRGIAYRLKHDYDKALADLNKAIEIYPKRAAAYGQRRIVYDLKGERWQTLGDFDKARLLGQSQ